jgi:hypothetical protein
MRPLFVIALLISTFYLNAQTSNAFLMDVEKLDAILKKTYSYKDQIKGAKKVEYDNVLNALKQNAQKSMTDFEAYFQLAQLPMLLKDNHLSFSNVPKTAIGLPEMANSEIIEKYKSLTFNAFPRVNINLDSLEKALKTKNRESVEGIYYYGQLLKMGVYRTAANKDSLIGVILESQYPHWEAGQILGILKEHISNRFQALYAHPIYKYFTMYKNEKYAHGSLLESHFYTDTLFMKYPNEVNLSNIPKKEAAFQLKTLDKDIQYLRLGNFSTYTKNIVETQKFHDSIKTLVQAKYLIVDLRNNGGGGFKTSQKFLNLLENYSKKGKIYALINHRTFSNAEEFAIKLKKFKNVLILGETTNGTLTYGSNYGNTETLPSGRFKVYPTDMKDSGGDLPYENVGVSPDKILEYTKDWVEQVVEIIKKNQ